MDSKRATILCVDDEEPGLQVRRMLLESAGYNVVCARSGAEGINAFQAHRIDAVVLDYWMSGMNGIAVAKELKRLSPNTPIMILSAYGTLLDESLGLADIWLRKGEEEPQYILTKLQELLDNRVTRQFQAAPPAANQ
jgi:CheY-like chemotaxis protein